MWERRPGTAGAPFLFSLELGLLDEVRKRLDCGTETLCSPAYWIYPPSTVLYASFKSAVKASGVVRRCGVIGLVKPVGQDHRGKMLRFPSTCAISVLIVYAALAGCGGNTQIGSHGGNSGSSSVVVAMTDSPPSNVSILSAEVTLTGATLTPGNVSLFSGSTTVELTRLQTDIAYIATAANIPAGNFTAVTLTFANPSLTIENDTASAIGTCAVGSICTMQPTSTANLATTVPLTAFAIASSSTTGLLVDVNLDNLLSATLGEDFSAGVSVTQFTPSGTGAPPVGAEDVVGQVGNINASSNTFTLTNAMGSFALKVENTSTFFQFPASVCSTPGFACLQNNQILSVDIGIQLDGSIVARNLLFEDADSSDAEVEGTITSTNVGSQQFNIVVLSVSAANTGLNIGQPATVQYSVSPQTPFDVDVLHADSATISISTSGFLFAAPADLAVGQQVSIRRHSTLPGGQILADRVRLRSSRISATVQTIGSGIISMSSLPSIFSGHGVTVIQAQTSSPTIFFEIGHTINISNIPVNTVVSVRGPLFNAGGAARPLVATKVVLK